MMMLPAIAFSLPNSLTPRRLPALSRPLRLEPPAFLWAMVCYSLESIELQRDAGNLEHRRRLAVAILAAAVLAATLLEDDNLLALAVGNDFSVHLGTGQHR